jgi:hypothetical protein
MTQVDSGFDYYFGFDSPEQAPNAWLEKQTKNHQPKIAPLSSFGHSSLGC